MDGYDICRQMPREGQPDGGLAARPGTRLERPAAGVDSPGVAASGR